MSITRFAPMLIIKDGVAAIEFYKDAFGAIELRRFSNDNGSIHVAELSIDGALFHLREINPDKGDLDALAIKGVTCQIELWTNDPYSFVERAVKRGAKVASPVKDYEETGYCEGRLIDPFGHVWLILKPIASK